MNPNVAARLRWARAWSVLAWIAVGVLVVVCLMPLPAATAQVPGGDKFQHLMAYFFLTLLHGQLGLSARAFNIRAMGFVALGLVIEWLQGVSGYRSADLADAVANTLGVLFGWVLAGFAPNYLVRIEQRLMARSESR